MHSNIWSTLCLALVPSTIIFIVAVILLLNKSKLARQFFIAGIAFLVLPVMFIVEHFASRHSEMGKRSGTYIVVTQDTLHGDCAGMRFDSLTLNLHQNGRFSFNYLPCFAGKMGGKWEWTDNMVHSYSRFDKLNDSLELDIPSEFDVDTVVLTNYKKRYLTFAKLK